MKRELNRRAAPAQFVVREATDGTIGFRGYAAVFNQEAYGEVIRPGAFDKTLAEQDDVRMLVNHDGVPIARTKAETLVLSVDDHGLLAEASNLDRSNPTVAELASAISRGDIDQMSFAGWFTRERTDDDGLREVTEIKAADVSVVTYPWYDQTSAELNSLDRALSDLHAGRALTPACRSLILKQVGQAPMDPRSFARAAAEQLSAKRDLNGWTFSDLYPLLDEALDDLLETDDNPYAWGYVWDVSDTWFVYWTAGGCYQIDFTVTAEGAITLGEPIAVIGKTTYRAPPPDDDSAEDEDEGRGMSLSFARALALR